MIVLKHKNDEIMLPRRSEKQAVFGAVHVLTPRWANP